MRSETYAIVRHASCGLAVRFERRRLHPTDAALCTVVVCPRHGILSAPEDFDPVGAVCGGSAPPYVPVAGDPSRAE